jgi:hypothetical protein
MASENYHGTFDHIWQDAWQFMINFYQHAPPTLAQGMIFIFLIYHFV